MDEKTEELRDIFMSVTDGDSVTETQEESRGSLTDERDDAELATVIRSMRDRYEFRTDLPDETLQTVVTAFYDGDDDEAVAAAAGIDAETVYRARMDLHLYTDDDLSPAFDADAARELLPDASATAVADALDADPAAVSRFQAALNARNRSLRASNRFRDQFDDLLADSALSRRLAEEIREDGLDDATEGMETDVSF